MIVGRPIKLFITTAAILAFFATCLQAAENKVVDAARKEGAVSFYTTMAATSGVPRAPTTPQTLSACASRRPFS